MCSTIYALFSKRLDLLDTWVVYELFLYSTNILKVGGIELKLETFILGKSINYLIEYLCITVVLPTYCLSLDPIDEE